MRDYRGLQRGGVHYRGGVLHYRGGACTTEVVCAQWCVHYRRCCTVSGALHLFHCRLSVLYLRTQTWYDDANSTRLKAEMAKHLGLGGVGTFTGENVGPASNGWSPAYWKALTAFLRHRAEE